MKLTPKEAAKWWRMQARKDYEERPTQGNIAPGEYRAPKWDASATYGWVSYCHRRKKRKLEWYRQASLPDWI